MVTAVMWLLGGVMMAFSPPPDGPRGSLLPVVGWAIMLGSVAMGAKVVLDAGRPDRAPRHSSGAEPNYDGARREALKVVLGSAGSAGIGIFCAWQGLYDGDFAVLGVGIVLLSMVVLGAPEFVSLTRWLIRGRSE